MRKNKSPLEKLVRQVFEDQPVKKRRFAQTLGYKNLNNAYVLIYRCLKTGEDHREILSQLPKEFGIDKWHFGIAWQATKVLQNQKIRIAQLEEELNQREQEIRARQNFKPYVYVKSSETRPTCSIVIYAFTNLAKLRYVLLPLQILQNSFEIQNAQVGEVIRKHFLESDGKCPGMGFITGYYYRNSFDSFIEFNIEGNYENSFTGIFFENHASAMIKNRTFAETPTGL